jgi:hypothetical protein
MCLLLDSSGIHRGALPYMSHKQDEELTGSKRVSDVDARVETHKTSIEL